MLADLSLSPYLVGIQVLEGKCYILHSYVNCSIGIGFHYGLLHYSLALRIKMIYMLSSVLGTTARTPLHHQKELLFLSFGSDSELGTDFKI